MKQKYIGKHTNTSKKNRWVLPVVLGALLLIVGAVLIWALGGSPEKSKNETPENETAIYSGDSSAVSWEAFEAMTPEEQEAFYNSFASPDEYLAWMESVSPKETVDVDLPWENGGKQPDAYTWDEYEALTSEQKTAFQAAFPSYDAFVTWLNRENPEGEISATVMPWDAGGKKPSKYTLEEFKALNADQQEKFIETFGSREAFEDWMKLAEGKIYKPWTNGGKQPDQYTWEEFMKLSSEQQEAFYESFASAELFDRWMDSNMPQETEAIPEETVPEETHPVETAAPSDLPWENGGKQPSEYTLEEFDALSEELKNAFYESFESTDAFAAWMDQFIS